MADRRRAPPKLTNKTVPKATAASCIRKQNLDKLTKAVSTLIDAVNPVAAGVSDPEKHLTAPAVLLAIERITIALGKDDARSWPARRLVLTEWNLMRSTILPLLRLSILLPARDNGEPRRTLQYPLIKLVALLTFPIASADVGVQNADPLAWDAVYEGLVLAKQELCAVSTVEGCKGATAISVLARTLVSLLRQRRDLTKTLEADRSGQSDSETSEFSSKREDNNNATRKRLHAVDKDVELIVALFSNVLRPVPSHPTRSVVDLRAHIHAVKAMSSAGLFKLLCHLVSILTTENADTSKTLLFIAELFQRAFAYADVAAVAAANPEASTRVQHATLSSEALLDSQPPTRSPVASQSETSAGLRAALARDRNGRSSRSSRWSSKHSGSMVGLRGPRSGNVVLTVREAADQVTGRTCGDRANHPIGLSSKQKRGSTAPRPNLTSSVPATLDEEHRKTLARIAKMIIQSCYNNLMDNFREYLEAKVRQDPLVGTFEHEDDVARDFVVFMKLGSFLTAFCRRSGIGQLLNESIISMPVSGSPQYTHAVDFGLIASTLVPETFVAVEDHANRLVDSLSKMDHAKQGIMSAVEFMTEVLTTLCAVIELRGSSSSDTSEFEESRLARQTAQHVMSSGTPVKLATKLLREFEPAVFPASFLSTLVRMTRALFFLLLDQGNAFIVAREGARKETGSDHVDHETGHDRFDYLDVSSTFAQFSRGRIVFNLIHVIHLGVYKFVNGPVGFDELLTDPGITRDATQVWNWLWASAKERKNGTLRPIFLSVSSLALCEAILKSARALDSRSSSGDSVMKLLSDTAEEVVDCALDLVEKDPTLGCDILFFVEKGVCEFYRVPKKDSRTRSLPTSNKGIREADRSRRPAVLSESEYSSDDEIDDLNLIPPVEDDAAGVPEVCKGDETPKKRSRSRALPVSSKNPSSRNGRAARLSDSSDEEIDNLNLLPPADSDAAAGPEVCDGDGTPKKRSRPDTQPPSGKVDRSQRWAMSSESEYSSGTPARPL